MIRRTALLGFALVYFGFTTFGQIVPPSDLIGWWPGDSNTVELVNGNDVSLISTATYSTGQVAQAFSLNGTSAYASAPDSPAWAFGTNEFTIELWANFAANTGQRALVGSDTGGGTQNKWIFWLNSGVLQFHINGPGIGAVFVGSTPFTPTLNQWYHLAVTRRATNYVFYVNGSAVSTNSDTHTVPDANAPLTIGSAEGALFFNGRLDEISIYNRALAGTEITNIFSAGSAGKDKSGFQQTTNTIWANLAGGDWNNATNWIPNRVPRPTDTVWITNSGTFNVTNSATLAVNRLILGSDTNGTQTLRLAGGTMTVTNLVGSSNSVIVMNGGDLTATGPFASGGRLDENSGTWRLFSTAALGTYNFVSGVLRGGTLTVTNMNWTDGNMNADANGDRTIIPSGGVLNMLGNATRYLSYNSSATRGRDLDIYGTWNWSGNNLLYGVGQAVVNNYGSVIVTNSANAQYLYATGYPSPTWNNHGSFTKSVGAGTFYFQAVYLNNYGSLNPQSGTVSFYSSAVKNAGPINVLNATLQAYASDTTNSAAITLDANSVLTMDSGGTFYFEPASSLTVSGVNRWLVNAGTMYLRTTNIISPSVVIAGGTLWHQTNNTIPVVNESSGNWRLSVATAVDTFNFTNGVLRGGTLTVTNLTWIDGNMNADANGDRTIIPASGVLNFLGNGTRYLSYNGPATRGRDFDNYGTWNWNGDSLLYGVGQAVVNNYGTVTQTGSAGNAQFLYATGYPSPTWNNYGTFTRASGSGGFYFQAVYLNNFGSLNAQSGTLWFYSSAVNNSGPINIQNAALQSYASDTTNTAAITLDANSFFTVDSGGTFYFEPTSTLTSPTLNHVKFNSGSVYLRSLNLFTPSFWLNGSVLFQQTNIVVQTLNQSSGSFELRVNGAIANYNLTNGELRGLDLTVTNCNWYDGNMNNSSTPLGALATPARTIIPAGGVMNILGTADRGFSYYSSNKGRGLDNYGTINWNAPILFRSNNGGVVNNYGNVFVTHTTGNAQFYWFGTGAAPVWNNFGTITRNTGSVPFYFHTAYLNNSGTINIQSGLFSIYDSTATNYPGALIQMATGATFQNDSGSTTTILPSSTLAGADYNSIQIPSGAVYLSSVNVASPSVWISGGTLYQQTNIAVSTINQSGSGMFDLRVPCTLANFNMTNGELRGRDLTVTNCNWLAGNQNCGSPTDGVVGVPDRTIIPAGGTLNISGAADRYLSYYSSNKGRGLDNYGTINWTAPIQLHGNGGATVNNYGAALVTAGAPNVQFDFGGSGAIPVWNNFGTLTRSNANTILYFDAVNLNNSGTMDIRSGTLSIYNSYATNLPGATIQIATGAIFQNDNTSVTAIQPGSTLAGADYDSIRIPSGSVYLGSLDVASPSIWISGGVLYQQTNIVVSTINASGGGNLDLRLPCALANLNLTNGDLCGRDLTVTNFNWIAGNQYTGSPIESAIATPDRTIIPAGGTLNISGAADRVFSYYGPGSNKGRGLDNYGTVNWSAPIQLRGQNSATVNNYGQVNVTAGSPNVQFDFAGAGAIPNWNNYGTLTRSNANTIFYFDAVNLNNSGTMDIQTGTLSIYNSYATNLTGGTIQIASGATLANDNTSLTYLLDGSVFNCAAANAFQINSGTVYVRSLGLSMPSLLIAGGTLSQDTNVVVPVINQSSGTWLLNLPASTATYNLTNGDLRGANLSLDAFNWAGGVLYASGAASNLVTVANSLNISGNNAKTLSYLTTQPGRSIINNGAATWSGVNITGQGGATIFNNGTFTVTNDVSLVWGGSGATPTFMNAGTFDKTAGLGTANYASTSITNSGAFNYNNGNLTVGGNFVQTNGTAFLGTNFNVNANLRVDAGTLAGRGNVAGYIYNNGVLNPGMSPGLITGATYTNSVASIVNIELAATNAPGTNYDQIRLTGAAQLAGTMNVSLFNNFAPQLSNSFVVMRFASRAGTYSTINPPPGVTLQADYSTTNLVLTVVGLTNAPLEITSFPSNQVVWTPDPVTFFVGVSGSTPITYQWQLNGTNLPNATNSSYSIAASTVTNAGTYTVQIADNYGATTNASATLTVIPFAGTMYWTNIAGGNWSVPANWWPNRVPGATNTAVISSNGNYTVTINADAAVQNLFVGSPTGTSTQVVNLVSGNTLALAGDSTFASNTVLHLNGLYQTAGGTNDWQGRVEWYSGTLSGAGHTIVATNATVFFSGSLVAKYVATNILENYGQFTYSPDGGYGSGQLLRFSGGAQLTNYPSGVINMKDNSLQYSGAQTPRSYLVNFGTIRTTSPGVFSPSYIWIDFINYGKLENYGYVYIARGTNYGEFWGYNTLAEISIFGTPGGSDAFSFEPGTKLTGAGPNIAIVGPVEWRAGTTVHNGRLFIAQGSGGATYPSAEFRVLANYTNTAQLSIMRGGLTITDPAIITDLHSYADAFQSFWSFGVTNAGTMYVDNMSHVIYGIGNGGTLVIRTNAGLSGGSIYGNGHVIVNPSASATLSGANISGQFFENFGTVIGAGSPLTGDTRFENEPNANVYFSGSLNTGPGSILNFGTMTGYGGISGLLVTNRGTVLANDSLGRNLALATYRQESGLTECGPGTLSGALDIVGGAFDGDCSLTGTLRNNANFSPGKPFGLFTVSGGMTNTASGVYNLPIKGATPQTGFPQVRVGGTANLGGTLNVIFTNGFTPMAGNLFTAMVFTARSGMFASIVNDTYGLEAFYTPTTLVLRAENRLPNASIFTFGGTTQLVCTPFKVNVTSSDPDGYVTNLVLSLNGTPIGSTAGGAFGTTAEFDFPGMITFSAAVTDDRGGTRYVSQDVLMTNAPLHVLQLGGVRTNAFKICMIGQTGSNYMMLATTNLADTPISWTPLGLMENTNGIWRYLDVATVTNRPMRFYRALQQ